MDDSLKMMLELARKNAQRGFPADARIMVANWLDIPYFQKVYNKIRELMIEEGQMTRGLAMYQCEKDVQMLEWVRNNISKEAYDQIKSALEGL